MVEILDDYGEVVERPQDIQPTLSRAFTSGLPECINDKVAFLHNRNRLTRIRRKSGKSLGDKKVCK